MSETIMKFVFTPNERDYINALRVHSLHQGSILITLAILSALSIFPIITILNTSNPNFGTFVPPLLLLLYIFWIFYWQPMSLGRQVNVNEKLRSEKKYKITEDKIYVTTSQNDAKYDWSYFCDFIESKEYFLIINSENKRVFQIIPKRVFLTPETLGAFRETLINKIRIPYAQLKKPHWYTPYRKQFLTCGVIVCITVILIIAVGIYNYVTAISPSI